VQNLAIHTSLWHARKLKDWVSYLPSLFTYVFHDSCPLYITCAFLGEGITIPTSREIYGTYLDSNEEEIKKHFQKFKEEWAIHGITFMCDSWTSPTGMSNINFMVLQ
jgi:hypothetical protein